MPDFDLSTLKLGRKPAQRPIGLPDLSNYETAAFPTAPATYGNLAALQAIPWGMDSNDVIGDCVEAGDDHLLANWNAQFDGNVVRPTVAQIDAQFNVESPTGDGIVEATHLELWATTGVFGNVIHSYLPAKLEEKTFRSIAAFLGGGMLGIACPESAQQQFAEQSQTGQLVPWTVVRGSAIAGGHCIITVGYTAEGVYCITWGGVVLVTWAFLKKYCEEQWAILSSQLVAKGADALGLELAEIESDFASMRAA